MVTGSGPTAFGLYPSVDAAVAAAEDLRKEFQSAIATAPLAT